ncbi:hypothetical protein [Anabaena subtropica]|uniref:Uncharacterized protein n=1 Tax=Anabaena subtropica FACHB-260 TaxID=2692884 RepID=A0ABR8CPM8_9NOST|nr:hypothetical protein [Anabaena subtropica]MBD2344339.1 hypothetical protein [Anabaena subtropica FACHB-260]
MKPNKNISTNQNQSSPLFTFLSVCAIAASTLVIEILPRSKNYNFSPTTEQQSLKQGSVDHPIESDHQDLEEIDIDKEWKSILGDKSKQELLAYAPPGV